VNVKTQKRVPLINIKKVNESHVIIDIQQSSKLIDPTKAKQYKNLKEITLHFKLSECNKDGSELQLIYCHLQLSYEAI
jgi:hypothetical protein